jgi:pimeloyl-ACP methyl ester carboxylesterase
MLPDAKSREARSRPWLRGCAIFLLAFAAGPLAATNPASRPILFVPGFCGSSSDFAPLLSGLYGQLNHTLYPSSTIYLVEYSSRTSQTIFFSASGATVEWSAIPSNTRFFSMEFYDPVGETVNPANVATISILNKAHEIEQAIVQITAITHVKDVIVLAHSMGGLDARAYVENMASVGACYDYQANTPNYSLTTCAPGADGAEYGGDVGDLITLDSPHAGTPIDTLNLAPYASFLGACISNESVNRAEMNPQVYGGPGLVEVLNYDGSAIDGVKPAVNTVPIQALEDYFSDVTSPWDNLNGNLSGYSDDIVQLTSQSIVASLPGGHSKAAVADVPIPYPSSNAGIAETPGCWVTVPYLGTDVTQPMMHFMSCLGALNDTQNALAAAIAAHDVGTLTTINIESTLNGKPWSGAADFKLAGPSGTTKIVTLPASFDDFALGTYVLSYISGGPPGAVAPKISASPSVTLKRGQWSAAYAVAFTAIAPQATTGAAALVTSTGASLKGTVNPERQAGQAFFEWSTSSTLASPTIACKGGLMKNCPAVVANATTQAVSAKITTAPSGKKIYYRVEFYSTTGKTYTYGKIG